MPLVWRLCLSLQITLAQRGNTLPWCSVLTGLPKSSGRDKKKEEAYRAEKKYLRRHAEIVVLDRRYLRVGFHLVVGGDYLGDRPLRHVPSANEEP